MDGRLLKFWTFREGAYLRVGGGGGGGGALIYQRTHQQTKVIQNSNKRPLLTKEGSAYIIIYLPTSFRERVEQRQTTMKRLLKRKINYPISWCVVLTAGTVCRGFAAYLPNVESQRRGLSSHVNTPQTSTLKGRRRDIVSYTSYINICINQKQFGILDLLFPTQLSMYFRGVSVSIALLNFDSIFKPLICCVW